MTDILKIADIKCNYHKNLLLSEFLFKVRYICVKFCYMRYVIEEIEDLSGEACHIYSLREAGSENSLFDDFVVRNSELYEDGKLIGELTIDDDEDYEQEY